MTRPLHDPARVAVGQVVKPHGIRGEVVVATDAVSPDLFARGATLFLRPGDAAPRPYTIHAARPHQGRMLVHLAGVDDRDAAEALRAAEVSVDRAALPDADEGEVYLHDILGAEVLLPGGARLGRFESFFEAAGQQTWVITADDGREVMLPAVDEFIADIDLDAPAGPRITIDPPEGLLDLYLGGDS